MIIGIIMMKMKFDDFIVLDVLVHRLDDWKLVKNCRIDD